MTKPVLAFDTETYLIGPGAIAPKMVCMSCSTTTYDEILDGKVPSTYLVGNGDEHVVEDLSDLFDPGHILVGQNTAYDLAVIAFSYPELEEKIWQKLEAGEVTDTKIREMLLNLSTHGSLDMVTLPDGSKEKISYTLAALEKKYLGRDRSEDKDGDDIWRLRYSELDGELAQHYPVDAARYAKEDAEGTLLVYFEQQRTVRSEDGFASLSTEAFHTAADFALFLITCRGMAIDAERFEQVRAEMMAELSDDRLEPLYASGILRRPSPAQPYVKQIAKAMELAGLDEAPADWEPWRESLEEQGVKFKKAVAASVDKKALCARIEAICEANGLPIKETASGGISADKEVIADLAVLDEPEEDQEMSPIECYEHRQKLQKIVTTELPRMMWEDEIAETVHFPFRVMLETGRTSSFANRLFPSGNGQQIHPKVRPCYVARPGFVLCSSDYSTLELGTFGQTQINLFGDSVHVDIINRGDDNHGFLAARLAHLLHPEFRGLCQERGLSSGDELYACFMECKDHSVEDIAEFFEWWRTFSKPNGLGFPGGLGPMTMISFAKKSYGVDFMKVAAGLPDAMFEVTNSLLWHVNKEFGMKKEDFRWTLPVKALALAILLRDTWRETYNTERYFDHVASNMRDPHNEKLNGDQEGYCYTSPMGMHRAGCTYTACANGFGMQTPAAEGAKAAVFEAVRATRTPGHILHGSYIVDFIHDELLAELVEDEKLHERACALSEIMVSCMRRVIPDVDIQAEPALMRRWDKKAKSVYDDAGRLVVWEPKS